MNLEGCEGIEDDHAGSDSEQIHDMNDGPGSEGSSTDSSEDQKAVLSNKLDLIIDMMRERLR